MEKVSSKRLYAEVDALRTKWGNKENTNQSALALMVPVLRQLHSFNLSHEQGIGLVLMSILPERVKERVTKKMSDRKFFYHTNQVVKVGQEEYVPVKGNLRVKFLTKAEEGRDSPGWLPRRLFERIHDPASWSKKSMEPLPAGTIARAAVSEFDEYTQAGEGLYTPRKALVSQLGRRSVVMESDPDSSEDEGSRGVSLRSGGGSSSGRGRGGGGGSGAGQRRSGRRARAAEELKMPELPGDGECALPPGEQQFKHMLVSLFESCKETRAYAELRDTMFSLEGNGTEVRDQLELLLEQAELAAFLETFREVKEFGRVDKDYSHLVHNLKDMATRTLSMAMSQEDRYEMKRAERTENIVLDDWETLLSWIDDKESDRQAARRTRKRGKEVAFTPRPINAVAGHTHSERIVTINAVGEQGLGERTSSQAIDDIVEKRVAAALATRVESAISMRLGPAIAERIKDIKESGGVTAMAEDRGGKREVKERESVREETGFERGYVFNSRK